MDVDHVCVGEGIGFMRELLGLPPEFKFKNPSTYTESKEILGFPLFGVKNPYIIVGLGCSYGCDFCSPSHFFSRRHIKFYQKGRALFEEMERLERQFRSNGICFVGDDNFLIDLERAEELRKCVVNSGKAFDLFIFGSADKVIEFGPERLAEMGVGTIWIGREGKFSDYRKNRDVELVELVAELRSYGIKTILSSILLLDQHTRENINEDIDDHLACRPYCSQFSYYAPFPGTPLFERLRRENKILTDIPFEEWHAFKQPWFIHPQFDLAEAEKIQERAYQRDFHELGPSLLRYIEAEYLGWLNLKDSRKPHLRARAGFFASRMRAYKSMLLAMERLLPTERTRNLVRDVRRRVENSFSKATPLERAAAMGLFLAGRLREFRTRHWGDALQPRTRVVRYNGMQ
jgi:haloalkane dehalogenase